MTEIPKEKLFREAFKDAADEADYWKAENERLVREIDHMCQTLGRIRDEAEAALRHEEERRAPRVPHSQEAPE